MLESIILAPLIVLSCDSSTELLRLAIVDIGWEA
jgi:hypothetical protein